MLAEAAGPCNALIISPACWSVSCSRGSCGRTSLGGGARGTSWGRRGEREPRSKEELGDLDGGSPGETGDDGEGGGKRHSSLGLLSIFMIGGTPSADFDLLPPSGDGDRDLLALREQKLPLLN